MLPFIEARNVTKVFGHGEGATVALSDFSYAIDEGTPSITAVAGESGSGKSTLARLLLGFTNPTRGDVLYRGKNLRGLSRQERQDFRREVQAVFQDPFGVYNPFYKVDHLLTTPVKSFKLANSRADARRQIEAALETVGLNPDEILGRYPHQLSGGQRQRVTIADDRPTITAIAGESGSGKSTLAHLLLGHVDQTAGSGRYRGREL
ncbi:MAG: hypothetical protein QOJ59_3645, partial [Thermomicrobiales bacterium]|nr:hypothetical protein [Thermomicrobiales bacterium]